MPTCHSCGGNYDDSFQFCPYCGNPKPKPKEPIKVDVVTHEQPSRLDCPRCHRVDSVSKVSAIVQGETHSIKGQIPVSYTSHDSGGWHSGTTYKNYHATQQSTLASRLESPKKPTRISRVLVLMLLTIPAMGCLFCFGSQAIFFLIGSILSSIVDTEQAALLGAGISLGTIIIICCVLLFVVLRFGVSMDKQSKIKHTANLAAWERSILKWRELYYCSRDDCIFIPGEGSSFEVSDLNDAINWHPV